MKDEETGTTAMQAKYYLQEMLPLMKHIRIVDRYTSDGKWEGVTFLCDPITVEPVEEK